MTKPVATVGILIIKEDKVLLVKHTQKAENSTNVYGLPAGRIEQGETEKQAAARELKEETGLETNKESLIELPTVYKAVIKRTDGEVLMTYKVFKCNLFDGEVVNSLETSPEWVELSRIKELNLLPNVDKAINEGLEVNCSPMIWD